MTRHLAIAAVALLAVPLAETKPADPATAGYAPPNAASSEAATVPPSGNIGAPARSFIAWRREGWRMSYSNLLLDCSTVGE